MQERFDNGILSLKEEGDSSHVNQACDKFVAKSDKAFKAESLSMLRSSSYSCGVLSQWSLVHVGLYAIRGTKRDTWTRSFDACNLDPRTRVSFGDWTKRIECFLQAGESFKAEAVDTYLLLPSFWHGMKPDERRLVVATVQKYQGYSIDCLKELRDVCNIPIKDMQHLQVCVECAKEHAEQLDRDAPDADTIVVAKSNPDIIVAAQADLKGATYGLDSFLIKPLELKGMDLFKHLRYKSVTNPTAKEAPSNFLDVEVTDNQRGILKTIHKNYS
jgi:hypothetical protein